MVSSKPLSLIRAYSCGVEREIIKPSDWNMKQSARSYSWRTNERAEKVSVNLNLIGPTNCWFIHRWQRFGPTDVATTEGPGGPHRGQTRETDQLHGQRETLTHQRRLTMQQLDQLGEGNKERTWTKGHRLDLNWGNKCFFLFFYKQQRKKIESKNQAGVKISEWTQCTKWRSLRQKTLRTWLRTNFCGIVQQKHI